MTSSLFCPLEPAWGDVAIWVSGIATLLTAALAVHLARRPEKIRLRVSAGFGSALIAFHNVVANEAPHHQVAGLSVGVTPASASRTGSALELGYLRYVSNSSSSS